MEHFQVHGQPCKGYDMGQAASEWITSYIDGGGGSPYRLIYHDFDPNSNPVNERKNPMSATYPSGAIDPVFQSFLTIPFLSDNMLYIFKDDTGLFADGFGFLLVTSGSMDDLNLRLVAKGKTVLDERWFRPNIYVKSESFAPCCFCFVINFV